MSDICRFSGDLATSDHLGIGGLLQDLYTVTTCITGDSSLELLEQLLLSCAKSLASLRTTIFTRPAHGRLAFREFGLSIGLQLLPAVREEIAKNLRSRPAHKNVFLQYVDAMLDEHLHLADVIIR